MALGGRRERRQMEHSRIPAASLYSWFLQKDWLTSPLLAYPFIPLKTASCYCAMQKKTFPVTLMVDSECLQQSLHRFSAMWRSALCYGPVNFSHKCVLLLVSFQWPSEEWHQVWNSHGTSMIRLRNWMKNHKMKVLLCSSSARWCPGIPVFPRWRKKRRKGLKPQQVW